MFEKAIQDTMKFTRAIHTISRTYGSTNVEASAATLFFINDKGWAVTCKHVVDLLIGAEELNKKWSEYRSELFQLKGSKKKAQILRFLKQKYGFREDQVVNIKNNFMDCVVGKYKGFEYKIHKEIDLAAIRIIGEEIVVKDYAKFPKDPSILVPGKSLCRIGFPFAEFTNHKYDQINDDIQWSPDGNPSSPVFPIDGMVTRRLLSAVYGKQDIVGFEMSTPGLKGQSGGPVFDEKAVVWGVQSGTAHLYLGFDVEQNVLKTGKMQKIKDHAFLHVGHCIHVDFVKKFLKENNIDFEEA